MLYQIVDRPDNKQYRELYGPQAALDAAKAGKPLPDGTVLTLVQYKARSMRTAIRERTPTAAS